MANKYVTVAVCTLNRESIVRQTIKDIWDQKYEPMELIIVDQTDELSSEMSNFYASNSNKLTLFRMREKGQGMSRNKALELAKGEVILYVDDDVRLHPNLIVNHLRHYSSSSVGAVTGRVDDARGDPPTCGGRVNWFGKVRVERNVSGEHLVESVSGGNMSMRTKLLRELGGFWRIGDNTVQMREETDLSLRIIRHGYEVVCDPEASLLHLAHKSGGSRTNTDRIRWYEDYFYAEFIYFFRNFSKLLLPFYFFSLSRPILACSFYYGRGKLRAVLAPWRSLIRALK